MSDVYYPYLMVLRRFGDKYPTEYPCMSMGDLQTAYNIFFDDDCEVWFFNSTDEIFPEWAQ